MQLSKALLCQLLALGTLLALKVWSPLPLAPWLVAGLQALLAAALSRLVKQPIWWQAIHLVFMPAILLGLSWQLPAWLYLAILWLLTLVFWGTVKGDVPLFLSSSAVSDALIDIVQRERAKSFVDIGAGLASVVLPLALARPQLRIAAFERAPLPCWLAGWRCRKLPNVEVRLASFWDQELGEFDVVFAFLSPLVMIRIGEKVRSEMRAGSLFVSSSFPIPDCRPESVLELADRRKTRLYCYRLGRC